MKDSDMPTPHHPEVQAGDPSKLLFDRRRLLQITAAVGGAAMLGGCAGGGRRAAAALPGPVWPHQESHVSMTPRPVVPAPVPPPVVAQAPVVHEPVGAIQILPRTAWTRGQPRWQYSKPMKGVTRITVHHDANNAIGLTGTSAITHRLNSIRESHLRRGNTWVDIGYHYIIDPEGRVWEGRPIGIEGAHVASTNDHNLGVMLLGNFEQHRPTSSQLTVLDRFLAEQMHRHNVPIGRVYTHQELKPTECPGRNLQGYMRQTRASRGRLALMA
ncbi:MAG TPA: peptidoglycan recognition family protein [Phycisphaerales bacterium]|nr:peptidoglycan recognition family protein [Phycisphaerales bacterium]